LSLIVICRGYPSAELADLKICLALLNT